MQCFFSSLLPSPCILRDQPRYNLRLGRNDTENTRKTMSPLPALWLARWAAARNLCFSPTPAAQCSCADRPPASYGSGSPSAPQSSKRWAPHISSAPTNRRSVPSWSISEPSCLATAKHCLLAAKRALLCVATPLPAFALQLLHHIDLGQPNTTIPK